MIVEQMALRESAENVGMDVLMGTAVLMGYKLSGFNDKTAKDALSSPESLNKIKDYLEDEDIQYLAKSLADIGMTDAMDKIEAKRHDIQARFNDIAFDTEGVSGGLVINIDE